MAREKSYKLGQYKIIESSNGGLWCETHAGLVSAKGGKCFIEANFLIIGPSETEESGFLKREFLEHLDQLPDWEKTKYYCPSHAVYECKTGRRTPFGVNTVKFADKSPMKTTHEAPREKRQIREPLPEQLSIKQHIVRIKEKLAGIWKALTG